MLLLLRSMLAWYLAVLAAQPLLTKSLTSASLAACSDAITQRLLGARLLGGARRLSLRRMLLMSAFGLLWYGPTNHAWQALLVSFFPPPSPGLDGSTSWVLALVRLSQRVAADQLLYAPLNNGLMILYVGLVADQRPLAAARAKLVAELPGVQRRGWRLWPAVQLVNQSLVPLELRVLCNNAVAVVWTAFVISRARAVNSSKRHLPVFSLQGVHRAHSL
ncbi:peroxisomal membrane PMP22 [Chlorella sorokiniana]|uniref:Peroxisomal membrane PMP22 n=1 Tax=Chlorella sorokiniana TaxID=3076 RepID=A0A2P6TCW9_CHLSO|nr:peroxisomal membrane PMP22 [Chlorella sorokiniana]|eukprot:PRW20491.1 peroxisomal membrane PMP22 [Chlorella sorokiniana]